MTPSDRPGLQERQRHWWRAPRPGARPCHPGRPGARVATTRAPRPPTTLQNAPCDRPATHSADCNGPLRVDGRCRGYTARHRTAKRRSAPQDGHRPLGRAAAQSGSPTIVSCSSSPGVSCEDNSDPVHGGRRVSTGCACAATGSRRKPRGPMRRFRTGEAARQAGRARVVRPLREPRGRHLDRRGPRHEGCHLRAVLLGQPARRVHRRPVSRLSRLRASATVGRPREYTDHAVSGATLLRSGFQAMMRDALNRRFDIVLAEALDRSAATRKTPRACSSV